MSSSPDPLASSPALYESSVVHSKRAPSAAASRRRSTTRSSCENISVLPPSSPSRTVTEQTLSPWKIRVTVEAEPENQENGSIRTTTRTIKVPLRGNSSPVLDTIESQKRSKPRSRTGSAIKGRQRSATPTADRRRRQSVTDLDIVVLGDDSDDDEWGKKAKRASPKKQHTSRGKTKKTADETRTTGQGGFEVRQDTDVEEDGTANIRDESPELRQIDLNRVSVRSRANSIKQKTQLSSDELEPNEQAKSSKPLPAIIGRRTVSANSAISYPTPSPTASERGRSVEAEDAEQGRDSHVEGFDTIMESEGFTMIDLDTLPSTKQMYGSSPVVQMPEKFNQPKSLTQSEPFIGVSTPTSTAANSIANTKPVSAIPPHLVFPEGESEISSTVPSSPPVFENRLQSSKLKSPLSYLQLPLQQRNRQVTPQPYSSPRLPSPPKQVTPKDRSTPDSAKAMKAGILLQGAIQPIHQPLTFVQQGITPKEPVHARPSSDELFDGYDSGTQRELRAGLRFGEELASRQPKVMPGNSTTFPHNQAAPATQIWRGESVISRTPIQAQAIGGQGNKDTETLQESSSRSSAPVAQVRDKQKVPNTEARREHQWYLERQSVSKQIDEASPGKVILIESDDESQHGLIDSDQSMQDISMEDEGDIWLQEAKDSSSSPQQEKDMPERFSRTEQAGQHEHGSEFIDKPRRSLIPSPWKRGEQLDQGNSSTIITNGEELSGIFWKQPHAQDDVGFGAAAINDMKMEMRKSAKSGFQTRRTSGSFDIEKMLGTPRRIRESLDKDQHQESPGGEVPQNRPESNEQNTHDDLVVGDHDEEEQPYNSDYSEETELTSDAQPRKIPVRFNDSSVLQSQITPPQSGNPRPGPSPSIGRPPTPRSAMKGSRQSFGGADGQNTRCDLSDQAARRVIFAERSKGVNVDWVESSSSLRSSAEDGSSSPIIEHQKHHQQRQVAHIPTPQEKEDEPPQVPADKEVKHATPNEQNDQKGWFGWLRKAETSGSEDSDAKVQTTQIDGTNDSSSTSQLQKAKTEEEWAPTSRHSAPLQDPSEKTTSRPPAVSKCAIPSYLLGPSYPSDPKRSSKKPLATSGQFSNTHFRTLHILHRKSQRPRFHAPKFSSCRPEIKHLVTSKWKLEVDESNADLGAFAWRVGEIEACVLERFCRELEFDHLRLQMGLDESQVDKVVVEWLGQGGIWGGNAGHGQGSVKWEWSVDQLATWLGRIVVGEVVREEEYGGINSLKS